MLVVGFITFAVLLVCLAVVANYHDDDNDAH